MQMGSSPSSTRVLRPGISRGRVADISVGPTAATFPPTNFPASVRVVFGAGSQHGMGMAERGGAEAEWFRCGIITIMELALIWKLLPPWFLAPLLIDSGLTGRHVCAMSNDAPPSAERANEL